MWKILAEKFEITKKMNLQMEYSMYNRHAYYVDLRRVNY